MTKLLNIQDKDGRDFFQIYKVNLLPDEDGYIYPIEFICLDGDIACFTIDEVDQIIGTLLAWRKKYYEENRS